MFRFGKQNDPAQFRMPTMSALPTSDDLHFILSKARRNWRTHAELSFRLREHPDTFTIIVQCEMGSGEPTWTLRAGGAEGERTVWSHAASDIPLVLSLIAAECTGEKAASEASETTAEKAETALAEPNEPLDQDRLAVESVVRSLCRPETGIFTYPAFLYFLDGEFKRFQRGGLPFSVAILQIDQKEGETKVTAQPLSLRAMHEAALRIGKTKRDIDILGHYGTFDLAFLLPHTDSQGAGVFALRISEALRESPLLPGMDPQRLSLHFGIASLPGDCNRTQLLIAAAANSMRRAVETGMPVVYYASP